MIFNEVRLLSITFSPTIPFLSNVFSVTSLLFSTGNVVSSGKKVKTQKQQMRLQVYLIVSNFNMLVIKKYQV